MNPLVIAQTFVTRLWLSMEASDRAQIRDAMWRLLDLQASYPLYVRNKTVKVIVTIARLEWPYSYPHFFQSIYQVLQQTFCLDRVWGLTLSSVLNVEVSTSHAHI